MTNQGEGSVFTRRKGVHFRPSLTVCVGEPAEEGLESRPPTFEVTCGAELTLFARRSHAADQHGGAEGISQQ